MKPPAFQFYAADFLMGTATMSAEEVGAYIRLLCFQWDSGSIPDDDATIARLGGCAGNAVAKIRQKFRVDHDGLRNVRLEIERTKQRLFRDKQAENGAKRWAGNAKPVPSHEPNTCSPSPSPSPVSDSVSRKRKVAALPLPFSSVEFSDAWVKFQTHRSQIKKPLTELAAEMQLKELGTLGEPRAIAAIEHTIRKGWQGIREPETPSANQPTRAPTAAEHLADRW